MIGVIISFLAAIAILFFGSLFPTNDNSYFLIILFTIIGALFFLKVIFLNTLTLTPLQKAANKTSSRIVELYIKDAFLRMSTIGLLVFCLFSFFCAYMASFLPVVLQPYLFAAWIFLLGIAADLLHHFSKRTTYFFDPLFVVKKLSHHAIASINNEKNTEICAWTDSLAEMSLKSIATSSTIVTTGTLDALHDVTNHFLHTLKSISHPESPSLSNNMEDNNETHYYLSYIFQRFEMINNKVIEKGLEPLSHYIVTSLGTATLDTAKCDISLAEIPLHSLGSCTKHAQLRGMSEVGIKATYVFIEVAKSILTDLDITYLPLQSSFKTLITQLEEVTKLIFKQDKEINILLLMYPFQQLKQLFTSPKCVSHQDTPAILQEIDRILGEFQALQTIMQVPPIPKNELG